jgi:hypothetical protein
MALVKLRTAKCVVLLGMLIFVAACRSITPHSLHSSNHPSPTNKFERMVLVNVPKVRPAFSQKWNPIFWWGNIDDPVPPEDYRPGEKNRVRKWYFRNPLHNFTFYVIGIADKPFVRTGRYPRDVFSPEPGWNFAVCKYKWVRLPFVAYQKGRLKFYFGWRERGNFGIKLTFSK